MMEKRRGSDSESRKPKKHEFPDEVKRKTISLRQIQLLSGIIVWPVWLGIAYVLASVIEELFGWHHSRPDWFPKASVIAIIGVGVFLWRMLANSMVSRCIKIDQSANNNDQDHEEIENPEL